MAFVAESSFAAGEHQKDTAALVTPNRRANSDWEIPLALIASLILSESVVILRVYKRSCKTVVTRVDLSLNIFDNVCMKKETAISIFGSGAALGRSLNLTRQAIASWPEKLCQWQSDRVLGAAIRLGKITPEQAKELIKDAGQRDKRD